MTYQAINPRGSATEMLPVPITEERPWVVFSACRDKDADLFFPDTRVQESEAMSICASCPVQSECLEYAFEADIRFGIWGGMNEKQRRRLVKRSA